MPPDLAMTALGQALDHDETSLLVADLDWESLPAAASRLFSGIPEANHRPLQSASSGGSDLRRRLTGMASAERERTVLDLVHAEMAAVLGGEPVRFESDRPFRELGFTSLTVLELRNRLNAMTDLHLTPTILFERPTPTALAAHVLQQLDVPGTSGTPSLTEAVASLEAALAANRTDEERAAAVGRLRSVLATWETPRQRSAADVEAATPDELLTLIDQELGAS